MDTIYSNYVSCMKIGKTPIIPPLMTEERRSEMRRYREMASNIYSNREARRLSFNSGVIVNASASTNYSTKDNFTVPSSKNTNPSKIIIENHVTDNDDVAATIATSPVYEEATIFENYIKSRRNSYTLDCPSPAMIEYLRSHTEANQLNAVVCDDTDDDVTIVPRNIIELERNQDEQNLKNLDDFVEKLRDSISSTTFMTANSNTSFTCRLTSSDGDEKFPNSPIFKQCGSKDSSCISSVDEVQFDADVETATAKATTTTGGKFVSAYTTPKDSSSGSYNTVYSNVDDDENEETTSINEQVITAPYNVKVAIDQYRGACYDGLEFENERNDSKWQSHNYDNKLENVLSTPLNVSFERDTSGGCFSDCSSVSINKFFSGEKCISGRSDSGTDDIFCKSQLSMPSSYRRELKEQLHNRHANELKRLLEEQRKETERLEQLLVQAELNDNSNDSKNNNDNTDDSNIVNRADSFNNSLLGSSLNSSINANGVDHPLLFSNTDSFSPIKNKTDNDDYQNEIKRSSSSNSNFSYSKGVVLKKYPETNNVVDSQMRNDIVNEDFSKSRFEREEHNLLHSQQQEHHHSSFTNGLNYQSVERTAITSSARERHSPILNIGLRTFEDLENRCTTTQSDYYCTMRIKCQDSNNDVHKLQRPNTAIATYRNGYDTKLHNDKEDIFTVNQMYDHQALDKLGRCSSKTAITTVKKSKLHEPSSSLKCTVPPTMAEIRIAAASKINAAVRGYFVRRLLRTTRVQRLEDTIKHCLETAMELQKEIYLRPEDMNLQHRVLQQSIAACNEIQEIFSKPLNERMEIIAIDREQKKYLQQKRRTRLPLSEATKKTIQRRKSTNSFSKQQVSQKPRSKSLSSSDMKTNSRRSSSSSSLQRVQKNSNTKYLPSSPPVMKNLSPFSNTSTPKSRVYRKLWL